MRPKPREILKKANLSALLVSSPTNVRYLSGAPDGGLLLVLPMKYILLADSLSLESAKAGVYDDVKVLGEVETTLLQKIPHCGIESEDVTIARLARWKRKFKSTKFVQTDDIVEEFRRSKDSTELKKMNRAHRITKEILRRIPASLRGGIREDQLAWKIETWARELGAEGMAFPSIVAFGQNTSRPHHIPTNRKLVKGDIVQIDIGAKYQGYCSDRSDVFFTGKPTLEQKKAYVAVFEAKEKAKAAVKVGASTKKLDSIAREVLKKYKLDQYFIHSLGHGVGLDIHEGARLSSHAGDQKLLKNEVITIEPGVYFPGKFGIRLEDMVVVE